MRLSGPDTVYAPPEDCAPWTLGGLLERPHVRYYSLGRWALVEALRMAGAPGRDVLLPDYICRELLACVRAVGARALFYPVDRGLRLRSDPLALPKAAAVVAVDYFGFPQDLAPFEDYCRRAGAVLIEDNAHGLFSRDAAGRPLGTRAPLGIFSLRKTLVLPNGGALVINDSRLIVRAPPQLPFVRDPVGGEGPSSRSRRRIRKWTPLVGARVVLRCIRAARKLRAGRSDGAAVGAPDPESVLPQSPQPCAELAEPLRATDPRREIERRRNLYESCFVLLKGAGVEPVFRELPPGVAPYVFPFFARPAEAVDVERLLVREGYFSLPWPDLPREVAALAPPHYSEIRGVHFLW